jgi:hypothetical protein
LLKLEKHIVYLSLYLFKLKSLDVQGSYEDDPKVHPYLL